MMVTNLNYFDLKGIETGYIDGRNVSPYVFESVNMSQLGQDLNKYNFRPI